MIGRNGKWLVVVGVSAAVAGAFGFWGGVQAQRPSYSAEEVYRNALTEVEGKEIRITRLEFEPGAKTPPHRHPGDTFVYVFDGELLTELDDAEAVGAKAGETFHEPPLSLHKSTSNPGETTAHAIAIMIIDKDKPSTVAP